MELKGNKLEHLQEQLQRERKLVSFDSYDLSVRQLLEMFTSGDIYIPPDYQRQFIWNNARQSQLVESVFLGIPVPSLFMATNQDATWEVVDGVQRMGTLAHFVGEPELLEKINRHTPLEIEGLEKLRALDRYTFHTLPKSIQLMFLTRPVRVTVLNDKSDLSVRFDLFERLNTGGVSLTQQEIRNCVYRGPFNDAIKELSNKPAFRAVVKLKPGDQNNGTKEEMVLRFFAFLERYNLFDHSVKEFLNDYMQEMSTKPLPKKLISSFENTFCLLQQALPQGIIRGNRQITPVNLFEAVSVGVALAMQNNNSPIPHQNILGMLNDIELRKFTTGATNSKSRVTSRINFVKNAII